MPEDISPISPLYLPYISQVGLDPEHELPEERYAARVTIKVRVRVRVKGRGRDRVRDRVRGSP